MQKKIASLKYRNILIGLLSADILFIVIHILHKIPSEIFPLLRDQAFSLTRDLGLAESFQYVKEFWIALLFFLLVIRFQKTPYLGWGFIFAFLLFDDMLSIHETLGAKVGEVLPQLAILQRFENLRPEDIGEVAVMGIIGIFILALLAVAYFRGNSEIRAEFKVLLAMFAILIIFGVIFDFFDRFFNARFLNELFKLFEDGGEMVAMSVICWYTFTLFDSFTLSKEKSK